MTSPYYEHGCAAALWQFKTASDDNTARNASLGALGTLGTAGLYALFRRVRLAKNPALRRIQQLSKGRLTGIEAQQAPILGKDRTYVPDWLRKQIIKTTRGVDDVRLTRDDVAKADAFNDTILRTGKEPRVVPQERIQGGVLNYNEPIYSRKYVGDVNPADNVVANLRLRTDKLREAELLQRYAPGSGPKPYGVVGDYIDYTAATPSKQLEQLQRKLTEKIPGGYIIKPRNAKATGDVLLDTSNLSKLHDGTGQKSDWVKNLLHNPDDYVIQERLPLITEGRIPFFGKKYHQGSTQLPIEYRVHTVGGQIIPKASSRRYPTRGSLNPFKTWLEKRRLIREIQPQIDKLPAELRKDVMMGLDVAKTKNGWRIIETNPVGGQSGFMAPDVTGAPTLAPHHIYKAVTGRNSKPMAAAKALAGGAGVTAAGAAGVNAFDA